MVTTEYKKPLPRALNFELTKPFWDGAKRQELLIPRCKQCGNFHFYPREYCPHCLAGHDKIEWYKATGKGRVYTFTIVRQPQWAAFNDMTPYIYAIIHLDEGVRMISNVIGCPVEDVKMDMRVEAVFDPVTPECTLVKFKPASE